jgi:hypothetical protein
MKAPTMKQIEQRLYHLQGLGILNEQNNDALFIAYTLLAQLRMMLNYNPAEATLPDLLNILEERTK